MTGAIPAVGSKENRNSWKLKVTEAMKKILSFNGTGKFIDVIRARHLTYSLQNGIHIPNPCSFRPS
jgi:hypothetical protein